MTRITVQCRNCMKTGTVGEGGRKPVGWWFALMAKDDTALLCSLVCRRAWGTGETT